MAQRALPNAVDDDGACPTVRPSFDLLSFARSQEPHRLPHAEPVRSAENLSLDEAGTTDMLKLPEAVFLSRLDGRVRRTELLLMLLRGGGLSRAIGARALRAQLEAIRRGAIDLGVVDLVALLDVVGAVVGELTETTVDDTVHAHEVLVLDEDEVQRDLIALAVESAGHSVRCAASFDEFVELVGERLPDVVLTESELTNAPARFFVKTLRDLVGGIPIVVFTAHGDAETCAALAGSSARVVSKEAGVEALVAELSSLWKETRKERNAEP